MHLYLSGVDEQAMLSQCDVLILLRQEFRRNIIHMTTDYCTGSRHIVLDADSVQIILSYMYAPKMTGLSRCVLYVSVATYW